MKAFCRRLGKEVLDFSEVGDCPESEGDHISAPKTAAAFGPCLDLKAEFSTWPDSDFADNRPVEIVMDARNLTEKNISSPGTFVSLLWLLYHRE